MLSILTALMQSRHRWRKDWEKVLNMV